MSLRESVTQIMKKEPERTDMIILAMGQMKSLDNHNNDPDKVFAYLNNVAEYTEKFMANKTATPDMFAPPAPPKSIQITQEDNLYFIDQSLNHASKIHYSNQQDDILNGNINSDHQDSEDIAYKQHSAAQNYEKTAFAKVAFISIAPGLVARDEGFRDATKSLASKDAIEGGVLGFLKGGKAGALKGYATGAARDMHNRRQHVLSTLHEDAHDTGQQDKMEQEASIAPAMKR